QTIMTTMLGNLKCSGFTNAAAAFSTAYQTLKGLGDKNALNVIVFFTDGIPNTITFGPAYGAGASVLPLKAGSSCTATPGFSGVIAGDVGYSVTAGIFKATNTTYPAPAPFPNDISLIGAAQGY